MKWSVIGAGGIADRRVIPALIKSNENKLVAVYDRTPAVAERIGSKYSVPYFTDAEEMLKSVSCDAVYIATPVYGHKSDALLALSYSKHVLLEKPIAMNAEESAEIANAFKKAGKYISVGYMLEYHDLHQKARKVIKSGKIGSASDVRIRFSCWYPDIENAWRQNKMLGGGGVIMDLGVHCLDLAEYILNEEISDVKAFCSTLTFLYEVEDSAVIIFRTKSGVLGHIDVNFNVPDIASDSKLEIYGSGGCIICDGTLGQAESGVMSYLYAPQTDYNAMQDQSAMKPQKISAGGGDIYLKQFDDFAKTVKTNKYDYSSVDRAVRVQSIVDKIYAEN